MIHIIGHQTFQGKGLKQGTQWMWNLHADRNFYTFCGDSVPTVLLTQWSNL